VGVITLCPRAGSLAHISFVILLGERACWPGRLDRPQGWRSLSSRRPPAWGGPPRMEGPAAQRAAAIPSAARI